MSPCVQSAAGPSAAVARTHASAPEGGSASDSSRAIVMSMPRASAKGSSVWMHRRNGLDTSRVNGTSARCSASRLACVAAGLRHRPELVGLVRRPSLPRERVAVADQVDGHRDRPRWRGPAAPAAQQRPVVGVRQQVAGFVEGHPARVVDLVARVRLGALRRGHLPVAHHLRSAARVHVRDGAEIRAEQADESCLLLHLPGRGRAFVLAGLELPFRERPVVVGRAVHEDDVLRLPASANDEAARGADQPHIQLRRAGSFRLRHAGRQRPPAARPSSRSAAARRRARRTASSCPI